MGVNPFSGIADLPIAIFIFVVLLTIFVFFTNIFFSKRIKKRNKLKEKNYAQNLIERGGAYVAKNKLLTESEQKVFHILAKEYGDTHYIFCQVRVLDVIEPNLKKYKSFTKEYKSLFWQISQWHFDYVLCGKDDFSISCVLELDDPSHNSPERVRRDKILNSVCKDAGVFFKRMTLDYKSKKLTVERVCGDIL
ncbi:hypothetical protein LCGC14_0074430 [marine sediment metagenome]|uniref:DUF2726 domain-containing protein n=1 Tax=marine sediment metagenome TaxID=412755 RepID=A0A0F9Y1T4_9ZZZZ|nr:DUF2726 domain-containing protein [Halomonas sp.]HDZ48790.1 DUF2726 domain-containing protein [Halomonas sp.]HEB05455.1 DUF2726 domain-containing protein [Halomonas sp.]